MIITVLFTTIFEKSRKIVKEMTKKTRAITDYSRLSDFFGESVMFPSYDNFAIFF